MTDKITDLAGKEIKATVSMKRKHQMIEKIYISKTLTADKKKEAFAKLASIDKSDMLQRTTKYCEAAIPDYEAKKEIWMGMIEMKTEIGVTDQTAYCRGLRQLSQLDILEKFEDPFFELIENCLETQGQSTSERVFFSL
jgi:hypothetical protein